MVADEETLDSRHRLCYYGLMITTQTWETYPLRSGDETHLGPIEQVSLTAYLIDGRWIPFHRVHGDRPQAQPLVVLG